MNKTSFDLYREAVFLCEERDFAGLEDGRHEFSEGFRKKMNALAANIERKAVRRRTARILIAAALIALLALFSVFGAGALREAGAYFHGVTHYSDTADDPTEELTDTRLPTYIPEGFEPFFSISDFNMIQKVWARSDGAQIMFIQQRDQDIMYDYYDSPGALPEYVDSVIDGDTIYYVSKYQSLTTVNWSIGQPPDPVSHFLLICGTKPDEAVEIALSVRLVEKKYNSFTFVAEKDGETLPGHDRIEGLYRLSRPPEGLDIYKELGCNVHHYMANYTCDSGEILSLRQLPIRYTSIETDSQHHHVYTVTRDGIEYNCIVSEKYGWSDACVIWVRYGYIFHMRTDAPPGSKIFSEQTVIDAAESLVFTGEYDWSDDFFIPEPVSPSDVSPSDVSSSDR